MSGVAITVTTPLVIQRAVSSSSSVIWSTGKAGVYHAVVRFPGSGTWGYEVYDGFTEYGGAKTHTFKAVEIGAASSGSGFPTLPVGGALLGLGLLAAVLFLRRPRPAPEPATGL